MRPIALCLLALALTACGAISALDDAAQPLEIYELRTPEPVSAGPRRGVEVVVEEPIASGALTTERIMIRPGPLQAQYIPGVRWADPAPTMVQTLLVRTLSQSGAFGSVGRRPVGTVADYAVLGELTDFQAETAGAGPGATVAIRLTLRVVRERDARVVASRDFAATESAADTDPASLVAAFDRAAGGLLTEIATWLAARTS
ncbi:hypothetical protein DXV76_08220 [Rhodobacteraceae bacterium CCMM004]|nr:hypothetical protein DXV76_08220 [Rhodobacteraceae bacterium CCMM004]